MRSAQRIRIKRIYDEASPDDGYRILVDRVWPRGVRKSDARIDRWLRDIAPSTELRKWFGHDPQRWNEFQRRYREELAQEPTALYELIAACREGPVTLLFAARDRERNQAVVLREVLDEALTRSGDAGEPASPVCYRRSFPEDDGDR